MDKEILSSKSGLDTASAAVKASTLVKEFGLDHINAISIVKSSYACEYQQHDYTTNDIEKVFPHLYTLTYVSFFAIFYQGREKEYEDAVRAFLTTDVTLETKKVINYILDTILHDSTYRFDGEEWDDEYDRVYQRGMKMTKPE